MYVPTLKWDAINIDLVFGLPRTRKQNDSIWVIRDRITESAHFIPVKCTYTDDNFARIYFNKIVSLHGIPLQSF